MSEVNDGLPPKQLATRAVTTEATQPTGNAKRQRVRGQTVFDMLLLKELITVGQWKAAHLFVEDLSASGASIPSSDLVSGMEAPPSHIASSVGDKRMIFSSAYRSMTGKCVDSDIKIFMSLAGEFLRTDIIKHKTDDELLVIVKSIVHCLDCLTKFYGVESSVDPRKIIRRQIRLL